MPSSLAGVGHVAELQSDCICLLLKYFLFVNRTALSVYTVVSIGGLYITWSFEEELPRDPFGCFYAFIFIVFFYPYCLSLKF